MARPEKTKDHCDICREIREGCETEYLKYGEEYKRTGLFPKCAVCSNTALLDRGNGTAVVCNACPRGYRMKLWLRHEELEGRDAPELEVA